MARGMKGLRIDEVSKHIGEEWVYDWGARVRIEGIEKGPEVGWRRDSRQVRKVRVTHLHPNTGKPEVYPDNSREDLAGQPRTSLVPARDLKQTWASKAAADKVTKDRKVSAYAARDALQSALNRAGVDGEVGTDWGNYTIEVHLHHEQAHQLAGLLAPVASDEEG